MNQQPHYSCSCEKWFDIPEWEGLYQVSNFLRFKSLSRRINCAFGKTRVIPEKILTINYCDKYPAISLWRNNKLKTTRVHTIVAKVFVDNPKNKPEVNHKNGNKLDFSVKNLEWCTKSENMYHAFAVGLHKPFERGGKLNPNAKLTESKVAEIRNLWASGKYRKSQLGRQYQIDPSCISDIINKVSWTII